MRAMLDPWVGTYLGNTAGAQASFDACGSDRFPSEGLDWCEKHHQTHWSLGHDARVAAIRGDRRRVLAWYWDDETTV